MLASFDSGFIAWSNRESETIWETCMFLNRLTAQSWVAVWTLMAAPAYVSFEEGGFGPRTWLDVAHLTYCVVVGVGGFIAILAADPLREPDR